MNTTSKVTSKGRLTIPFCIRDKFNFDVGVTVEFEEMDDYVIIRKPRKPRKLMDYAGCLNGANLPNDLEELLTPEVGRSILERE